jgi:hypothetical protein
MGYIIMIVKILILLFVITVGFLLLCIWALCKSASIRDRQEEARRPKCYTPNNDPYPLCKGNGSEDCQFCCLYEGMPEDQFYDD